MNAGALFPARALALTPARRYSLPRQITEAQARRLRALAFRAGHTEQTFNRALRLDGYFDASDIFQPDYDSVVERHSDDALARRLRLPLLFDYERPHVIGAVTRDDWGARKCAAYFTTETLCQKSLWYAGLLTRAHMLEDDVRDELARQAEAVALEMAYRTGQAARIAPDRAAPALAASALAASALAASALTEAA